MGGYYYDGMGAGIVGVAAESEGAAPSASYIVQEEDGTSKILLEEGTDFLLLEESS